MNHIDVNVNVELRYALIGRIVTMDAAGTVLERGAIYIQANRIAAVQPAEAAPPAGFEDAPRIDTHGTLYPGLIELHNHLSYNILPIWNVPRKFGDRRDWRANPDRIKRTSTSMSAIAKGHREYVPAIARYVECKCLISGTTTSQGMSLFAAPGISGKYRGLVRNVEQSDDTKSLPSAESHVDMGKPADMAVRIQQASCVLLHVAEGTGQRARDEFLSLQQPNKDWAISPSLVAIHCLGLKPEDFDVLGAHGGAMVWSPMSNLMLYGATADVAQAKRSGVPIALGADWSPTGSKNLLGELKVAWLHSQQIGNPFTPRELLAMATTTPAAMLKWNSWLGSLEAGKLADILVVHSEVADPDPYLQLLRCSEVDIALVIIDGMPRYGTLDLLQTVGQAAGAHIDHGIEPWQLGNQPRGFYLGQATAHPAVAALTLKMSADYLREALAKLPDPPGFPPPSLDIDTPELTLDLDNNEDPGALSPDDDTVPEPMPLDELTVAEAPETYFTRVAGQMNLPDYVKQNLPALYQEKSMPQGHSPYFSIDNDVRTHLENLSTCRDTQCPVPNQHPFYPVPEQPPLFYGKRSCMPVVPTRLTKKGVMVIGIYPNCRRATVTPATGSVERSVPIEDADEPFEYARYFDGYSVRDLRAGTILQKAYWTQLGLDREKDMWITNFVKCFMMEKVDIETYEHLGWNAPAVSETRKSHYFDAAARCVQLWLAREVELCQPKLVVTMGNEGCRIVHGRTNSSDPSQNQPFTHLRGRLLRAGVKEGEDDTRTALFKDVNVFHCYHPSGLSLINIDKHLNSDMSQGRQALVDLGLADSSLLNYAITPEDIAEIKGIIRVQN